MASIGKYIAVVGGFKASAEVEVFSDGHWRDGPHIQELNGLIHHTAVGFGDSNVIVIGGFLNHQPTDRTFILDLEANEVYEGPHLNKKRFSHASTRFSMNHEEYIAVAGGFDEYHVCKSVEILKICDAHGKIAIEHWETLPDMNIPRHTFGLEVLGTQLAAFGGEPTIESEKIEVYNVEHQAWEFTGESVQFSKRHYFAAVSVPDSAVSGKKPSKPEDNYSGSADKGEDDDSNGKQDDSYGKQDDSYGKQDDSNGKQDDSYGKQDDSYGKQDDSYGKQDDSYGKQDDSYGKQDDSYGKQDDKSGYGHH